MGKNRKGDTLDFKAPVRSRGSCEGTSKRLALLILNPMTLTKVPQGSTGPNNQVLGFRIKGSFKGIYKGTIGV